MKKILSILLVSLMMMFLVGCNTTAKDNDVLKVGMECNYAPYNWSSTTPSDTSVKISSVDYCDGYDVMMASKLAEKLGKKVEIVKLDWDNLILSLQHDQIDAVIAGMTATEKRMQQADFTSPYYISTEVVIVRKNSDLTKITSIAELSGKKVMGQMNTLYDTIIDQIPNVIHEPASETFPAAIQALQAGAIDAVTSELPVAIGACEANTDLTYILFEEGKGFGGAEKDAAVSIAVKKGNKELLDALDNALNEIDDATREDMMLKAVENQPSSEE